VSALFYYLSMKAKRLVAWDMSLRARVQARVDRFCDELQHALDEDKKR
jgi:hypothetical protein